MEKATGTATGGCGDGGEAGAGASGKSGAHNAKPKNSNKSRGRARPMTRKKAVEALPAAKSSPANAEEPATPPEGKGAGGGLNGTSGRRERKQKFDVRKLLNIRGSAAASGSPSNPSSRRSSKEEEKLLLPSTPSKRRSGRGGSGAAATGQSSATTNGAPQANEGGKSVVVSGKRERKRKKFWDEISPTSTPPPVKVSKRGTGVSEPATPNTSSSSRKRQSSSSSIRDSNSAPTPPAQASSVKNQGGRRERKSSGAGAGAGAVPSSAGGCGSTLASGSSSKNSGHAKSHVNGDGHKGRTPVKDLKYLAFDLSQDPAEIAKTMVEGVNIPGPGDPIPVASTNLPTGWEKKVIQRGIGITKGKWDVFIQSPQGKSFRSKMELQRFFDEKKLSHTSESFDFSLDDTLKKLRQIWKSHIVIPQMKAKAAAAASAFAATATAIASETAGSNGVKSGVGLDATTSESYTETPVEAEEEGQTEGGGGAESLLDGLCAAEMSEVAKAAAEFGLKSETGQGIRCSVDKCGKLFRNDKLLHMHVKHYHPTIYDTFKANHTAALKASEEGMDSNETFSDSAQHRSGTSQKEMSLLQAPPLTAAAAASAAAAAVTSSTTSSSSSARKRKSSAAAQQKDRKNSSSDIPESPNSYRRNLSRISSSSNKRNSVGSTASLDAAVAADEDDDEDPTVSGRNRNDSILSVGSEASIGSGVDMGEIPCGNHPPTFRVSKRRQLQLKKKKAGSGLSKSAKQQQDQSDLHHQQQLHHQLTNLSPILRMNKLDDTSDGRCYMEEYMSFIHSKPVTSVGSFSAVDEAGSASMPPSYPPSEMDASIASEHLTSEEVVNCKCKRIEEDGLMIQCDICLCWQHGVCLGLDDEDQVPDKHLCQICKESPGARTTSKFALDQDWLKEGKLNSVQMPERGHRRAMEEEDELMIGLDDLPLASLKAAAAGSSNGTTPSYPVTTPPSMEQLVEGKRESNAFRKLSDLMADLSNLNRVLHSLRIKLYIASQRNHSKVFMWSSAWEEKEEEEEEEPVLVEEPPPSVALLTAGKVNPIPPPHRDPTCLSSSSPIKDTPMVTSVAKSELVKEIMNTEKPTSDFHGFSRKDQIGASASSPPPPSSSFETPPVSDGDSQAAEEQQRDFIEKDDDERNDVEKEKKEENHVLPTPGDDEKKKASQKVKPSNHGKENENPASGSDPEEESKQDATPPICIKTEEDGEAGPVADTETKTTEEESSKSLLPAGLSSSNASGADSVPSPPVSDGATSTHEGGSRSQREEADDEVAPSTLDTPSESPLENRAKEERLDSEEDLQEDEQSRTAAPTGTSTENPSSRVTPPSPPVAATAATPMEVVDDVDVESEASMGMIIPSMSEVERLLPSLIEGLKQDLNNSSAPTVEASVSLPTPLPATANIQQQHTPTTPFIPEQKRIDKDESRLHLVDHIHKMQDKVESCLDHIEGQLGLLEAETSPLNEGEATRVGSTVKSMTVALLHDVSLARKMISEV